MAARPSSSMSLSVFIATFKIWIGSSWTLWITKQTHIPFRGAQPQKSKTSLWLWDVCRHHLIVLFSIQNRITSLWEAWTWGRRVREATQHVRYVPVKEKKMLIETRHRPTTTNISKLRPVSCGDWPGELLEGAERDHSAHALTGRRERCVQQNITHAGHVHHAVVVQVGWEGHPVVLTGSSLEWDATTPLKQHDRDFKNLTTVLIPQLLGRFIVEYNINMFQILWMEVQIMKKKWTKFHLVRRFLTDHVLVKLKQWKNPFTGTAPKRPFEIFTGLIVFGVSSSVGIIHARRQN